MNSIGGRLKPNSLICKNCNSKLGDSIDTKLSEDLNEITNILNDKELYFLRYPFSEGYWLFSFCLFSF